MRVSDLVRDYIRINVVPTYLPAITWNEDQSPYVSENAKIIFTKQMGRPVDAYVRQSDVEILLFSAKNANLSDLNSLFNDAETVLEKQTL
jgi:hypothetical protein